jgi:hypothetical protein
VTDGASIAFHASAPDGAEAHVILLERCGEPSRVRMIEWEAGAYHLPGRADQVSAQEMAERVESWRRAGWRFSESVFRIQEWLRSV